MLDLVTVYINVSGNSNLSAAGRWEKDEGWSGWGGKEKERGRGKEEERGRWVELADCNLR